jgi:tricorn protease
MHPTPRTAVAFVTAFATIAFTAVAVSAAAPLEESRLLRQPDIQLDRIVFVYAGDLWTVGRAGGAATRLTSHEGVENFPKFSPDGRTIAFTGEYDGNVDAFTVPAGGGEPTRLTWHPDRDMVAEWYPDGNSILVRSPRASTPRRFDRFWRIPAAGGFEELLPLPTAGYASFSADGNRLAFVAPSYDNRTWKRYQGGNAPDIWLYDFRRNHSEKISDWAGADEWPMWHANRIYYASDRGGRTANLWSYDLETRTHRQVTKFDDYDVKWPSVGGDAIVFENGGYLYVMDLPGEQSTRLRIQIPDDRPGTRPSYKNLAKWITGWDLSPTAKRAVLAARGELFTVPAEKGDVRNLSRTPGARERDPVWSPDGKWVAFLSDRSGEYELHVVPSDASAPDRQLTKGGKTFRFAPRWSPDSKKLAFSDKTMTLWWCDVAGGRLTRVDHSETGEIHEYTWSGDSRWLAYARPGDNWLSHVRLYSLDSDRFTEVTGEMTDDTSPTFDPAGRYLYFLSRRTLNPTLGAFEFDFDFTATDKIYALTLRDTTASPAAPRSDEEGGGGDGDDDDGGKTGSGKDDGAGNGGAGGKGSSGKSKAPWRIDLTGIQSRVAVLPMPAGRYRGLQAFEKHLLYAEIDEPGQAPSEDGEESATLHRYDLEKREAKPVIAGVEPAYRASLDGKHVLYKADDTFGVVETEKENKPGDGKLASETLMATVDPRLEWRQMFEEAWRLERDFYYDPAWGGLNWEAVGERYRQLLPHVAHRADMNYILGELIGELSTSHAYVGGGDMPAVPQVAVGLLGADWELDRGSGRYRVTRVYRERDWNSKIAAPLGEPGVNVREGDYLLAVDGRAVRAPENLYAAFVGTVDRVVRITVGRTPGDAVPRTYAVKPIANEGTLRYAAMVRANRDKVAERTNGRIAYIHLPNTAHAGIQEFTKQYYPQIEKQGIIVDERWNGGGFIPDFFVEKLQRTTWAYWSSRDGRDFRTPGTAIDGPKCILINEYAGSGGDALPYYFRLAGLGPLIGKRTWGGLVGIGHDLPLVDGGRVTMPDFGMWDREGRWTVENRGVEPDIEVENAPHLLVEGRDPQLERAIEYCLDELAKRPPKRPARPPYKVQTAMPAPTLGSTPGP